MVAYGRYEGNSDNSETGNCGDYDVVKELLFPKDVEISIGLSFLKRKLSAYIRLN